MNAILKFAAGGLAAAALFAQEPKQARPNFFGLGPSPDAAAVSRGEQSFVANCGFCHGSQAKGGNNGPDLVRSVLVLHDEGTGNEIGPVILQGRPAKGMPKFAMTNDQIKDISAFLLARTHATINRGNYELRNLASGDAKTGEAFFRANCTSCHSATGDLAHIATKYDQQALQLRFLYPKSTSGKAPTTVTVTPPTGKAVSGTLNWLDDYSVSLTDSTGQRQSWKLDGTAATKVVVRDPLEGHELLLKRYTDSDMHNILTYLVTLK